MRMVLAGCVLAFAVSVEPAVAQEAWPFTSFPSLRKQAGPTKRAQPRPKAEPAKPEAMAALDPAISPANPQAQPTEPQPKPAEPQPPAAGAAVPDKGPAPWQWRIMRTTWTERDEKGYEEFVQRIGESGCRNMHACLAGAQSNPLFRASNPPGMHFYADCADLPYMLRAYYAWKNGLPFSYSTAVTPLGYSRDIRYTALGNSITSRRELTEAALDARKAIPQIVDTISSAHYRYPPEHHGQAAARSLPRPHHAREHQARHHHLRPQRPRRRGLQGDAGGPHPLHRHPSRQFADARRLRQGLHALLAGHGCGLQALAPADAGRRHAAHRRQLPGRPYRPQPRQGHRRLVGRAVLRHREGAAQDLERGQVRARGRDARVLRLRAQAACQCRLQIRPAGGDALDGALACART